MKSWSERVRETNREYFRIETRVRSVSSEHHTEKPWAEPSFVNQPSCLGGVYQPATERYDHAETGRIPLETPPLPLPLAPPCPAHGYRDPGRRRGMAGLLDISTRRRKRRKRNESTRTSTVLSYQSSNKLASRKNSWRPCLSRSARITYRSFRGFVQESGTTVERVLDCKLQARNTRNK